MKFTKEFDMLHQDVGQTGTLRLAAVWRCLQEAAAWHLEQQHPTSAELRDRGYTFLVSRFSLHCYAPLTAGERVTAQTWACPPRGASFERCYQLLRGDEVVAEAIAVWALADVQTHALCRADAVQLSLGTEDPLPLSARFRLPTDGFETVGQRPVYDSDSDTNGHMNNTRYVDVLCDFLPAPERACAVSLRYAREARCGDVLTVQRKQLDDTTVALRTVFPDGSLNTEALICLTATESC